MEVKDGIGYWVSTTDGAAKKANYEYGPSWRDGCLR